MEIILLILLTFIASTIGTLAGFGTSTIMIPILSLFYPFPLVLIFVGIIHWLIKSNNKNSAVLLLFSY